MPNRIPCHWPPDIKQIRYCFLLCNYWWLNKYNDMQGLSHFSKIPGFNIKGWNTLSLWFSFLQNHMLLPYDVHQIRCCFSLCNFCWLSRYSEMLGFSHFSKIPVFNIKDWNNTVNLIFCLSELHLIAPWCQPDSMFAANEFDSLFSTIYNIRQTRLNV